MSKEELTASFIVDKIPRHVWEALRLPGATGEHCRLPGFPDSDEQPGAEAIVRKSDPERLLHCRKAAAPFAGSEIVIRLEPVNAAGYPTRVTLSQSGFGVTPEEVWAVMQAHWRQIVADFQLYVVDQVLAPLMRWGPDLGVLTRETQTGLAVAAVTDGGCAARCGLETGDLILSVCGVRICDTGQLCSVMAMTHPGQEVSICWVRAAALYKAAAIL